MKIKNKKIIIAIDGYSGCGKSSTAKLLAKELDYKYLDSGSMYRAVTLFMINNSVNYHNLIEVNIALDGIKIEFKKLNISKSYHINLNGVDVENKIRSKEVSELVSQISLISNVRKKLVNLQRSIGMKKGIVMEGRDIATVVFPNAELKIFMKADLEERALRRYNELKNSGNKVNLEEVKNNLMERDKKDTTRQDSPLKKAPDSLVLDTTSMTLKQQIEYLKNEALKKIN